MTREQIEQAIRTLERGISNGYREYASDSALGLDYTAAQVLKSIRKAQAEVMVLRAALAEMDRTGMKYINPGVVRKKKSKGFFSWLGL